MSYTVKFEGLENGIVYYVRVFPMNPDREAQSEVGTQTARAVPKV